MTDTVGRSALAMYDLAPIRPAVDALWAAVRERVAWIDSPLEWDVDLHRLWSSSELVVSQTCGWPLVTSLAPLMDAGDVRVLGTFVHDIPEAEGHTYRSVLVAGDPSAMRASSTGRAAVNSFDSLSGWVSLRWGVLGSAAAWPGEVVITGSHAASLAAVADGKADIASLDAVTWALSTLYRPELTAQVTVVGHGPRVPCLPLIAGRSVTDERAAQLRVAFAEAVAAPAAAPIRAATLIERFVPLDRSEYDVVRSLA